MDQLNAVQPCLTLRVAKARQHVSPGPLVDEISSAPWSRLNCSLNPILTTILDVLIQILQEHNFRNKNPDFGWDLTQFHPWDIQCLTLERPELFSV